MNRFIRFVFVALVLISTAVVVAIDPDNVQNIVFNQPILAITVFLVELTLVLHIFAPPRTAGPTAAEVERMAAQAAEEARRAEQAVSEADKQALTTAWWRFIEYDETSKRLKKDRTTIRQRIILFGLATSALAVIAATSNLDYGYWQNLANLMEVFLAVLPILTTLLIGYASEFSPINAWSVYRVGAELIRREIYLFRTRAGVYTDKTDQERRELLASNLAKAIKVENVQENDSLTHPVIRSTVDAVLKGADSVPYHTYDGKPLTEERLKVVLHTEEAPIIQPKPFDNLKRPFQRIILPATISLLVIAWSMGVIGNWTAVPLLTVLLVAYFFYSEATFSAFRSFLTWIFGSSVPKFFRMLRNAQGGTRTEDLWHSEINDDDGYSPITIDTYIKQRFLPQLKWYNQRLNKDYDGLRNWRIAILVTGGVGSAIVAVSAIFDAEWSPYVAITTAIGTAIGLHLELKMFSHTYQIYQSAQQRLQALYDEWKVVGNNTPPPKQDGAADAQPNANADTDGERQATNLVNLELMLIDNVERAFQREREDWMLRVIQSQSALERKLSQSSESSGLSDEDLQSLSIGNSLKTLAMKALAQDKFEEAEALYRGALEHLHKNQPKGAVEAAEGLVMVKCQHLRKNKEADNASEIAMKILEWDTKTQQRRNMINAKMQPNERHAYRAYLREAEDTLAGQERPSAGQLTQQEWDTFVDELLNRKQE